MKSQWSVPIAEEVACWEYSVQSKWCQNNSYWGLHIQNASPINLGISPKPDEHQLFVAKFVGDHQGNWHGYPVASWLSPFDKPTKAIVDQWKELGFINGSQKARIIRGKLCTL